MTVALNWKYHNKYVADAFVLDCQVTVCQGWFASDNSRFAYRICTPRTTYDGEANSLEEAITAAQKKIRELLVKDGVS